jgi:dienelactone hydrolase
LADPATKLPSALLARSRPARFDGPSGPGSIPVLLAHPDWSTPAPTVIWLHGRTATKELDNGRYLRWLRHTPGIAACAVDLPAHGERANPARQGPDHTLALIAQAVGEIDAVVTALAAFGPAFDATRLALGGMSLGGMVALRRLTEPHPFRCAAVEATAGDLTSFFRAAGRTLDPATAQRLAEVDPLTRVRSAAPGDGWRPIPLLALHSEADAMVPVAAMRPFISELRGRYAAAGADPALVELKTWPKTGAPHEHLGFGLVANDAKLAQLDFFARRLVG